ARLLGGASSTPSPRADGPLADVGSGAEAVAAARLDAGPGACREETGPEAGMGVAVADAGGTGAGGTGAAGMGVAVDAAAGVAARGAAGAAAAGGPAASRRAELGAA